MTDRVDDAFAALDQLESPLSWAEVTTRDLAELPQLALAETEPRRPRRPVWQALSVAASVLVIAGGVWFAIQHSDSSHPSQRATTGLDTINVGVATLVIPDGVRVKASVTTEHIAKRVLRTPTGMCTMSSDNGQARMSWARTRNAMEVERFTAELQNVSQRAQDLEARAGELDQRIASMPPGSDEVASIVSQRDIVRQELDRVNEQALALSQEGPSRVPTGEGFTPTDASRTTYRAQATPSEVVQITCPDQATSQQLVDATSLPRFTP